MHLRKTLAEIVFWLHLPIVIIWFGLFLIPKSIWPGRITFHFLFIVIIVIIQFLWGLVYFPVTKKIDIICPLTTLMQWLRGFSVKSKKNYRHSFVAEILNKYNIKINYKSVNIVLLITLILIFIQYIWFN